MVTECQNIKLSLISLTRSKLAARDRHSGSGGEIDELAQSMKQHGLIEPVIVRPTDGKYELIAGNRRYLAAKSLDWERIPSIIREATDIELRRMAFIENVYREDLSDSEKAKNIAEIYQDIGFKAEESQKILFKLHNSKYEGKNYSVIFPNVEFKQACNDIGLAHITQAQLLQLITDIDPETLEEAEKAGLTFHTKQQLVRKELRKKAPAERKMIQKEIIKNVKDYKGQKAKQKAQDTVRKHIPRTQRQQQNGNLIEKVMDITSATDQLIELITGTPLGRAHVHYTDKMINDAKPKIFAFIKAIGDNRQLDAFEEDMSILEYLIGIVHETVDQVRKSNEKQREILKP